MCCKLIDNYITKFGHFAQFIITIEMLLAFGVFFHIFIIIYHLIGYIELPRYNIKLHDIKLYDIIKLYDNPILYCSVAEFYNYIQF